MVKKDNSIDFSKLEKKWQSRWEKKKIFQAKEKGKKFYVLEMFPYPSGSGLHMGHAFNYTIGDIYARLKRMQGFNVLYPMGYDSLGLPAENAAIKEGTHPKKYTEKAIKNFVQQQKSLGLSYDWTRMVKTSDPDYYKWDQWIFLKMLEKGLAERKKAPVNWCPKCKTVLANEQVHDGRCWRHTDIEVETRQLEQWFLKITDYADELYEKIDKLKGWPERIKAMQKNWIGKSHGIEIDFDVNRKKWPIFTTRPDTIYGVTFMVVSAQHPALMELVTEEQKAEVEKFLEKLKSVSEKQMEDLEKEGVFTGSYAKNPLTEEEIPIWVGNFVVAEYGSGMVMAVPAHDQRDFEFAKKYKIPIKVVINPRDKELSVRSMKRAYVDEGVLVASDKFDGLDSKKAIEKVSKFIEQMKLGRKIIQFRLKDWLVSRQRYWGTPIPVIYCDKCGIIPVEEKDLPVKLPEKVKFGKGNPLETVKSWIKVKCPKCGGEARRETDTMDTFVNSSWYFLRYCDSKNKKEIFDKKKVAYWCPIDQYIGGAEHACMHLIYFRFYTKFLRDLGLLKIDEPAAKLFNQGMLHGSDGYVMSKSRGNVVLPEEVSKKYGIDTARLFLVSLASPDKDIVWSKEGIEGSLRFVKRVVGYYKKVKVFTSNKKIISKYNKTVKEVTDDIENFRYNLAIIKLRELFDKLGEKEDKKVLGGFLKMLSVFCPHVCEELWSKMGNKNLVSIESWPKYDEKKIDLKLEEEEKKVDKLIDDIRNILRILEQKGTKSREIKVFAIPNEINLYKTSKDEIEKNVGLDVEILSVKEAKETGKAIKAKPGKPGILVE
jgi:leucyl-tRNA synthetase